MTTKPKIKPVNGYLLPSQRILNILNELKQTETPMGPSDVNIMIELAILDKLEEVVLTLRTLIAQPEDRP
jgi:hypothetical protein